MKLLIITQKADRLDPILGFFHRWLEEFGKDFQQVTVIAQAVGTHDLPENVTVYSMGKEKKKSKWAQIWRFWKLIISEREHYEAALVHMTPIWVILGAPIWFFLGKRVYLWYEIKRGGGKLKLAQFLARKVFSATAHGMPKQSSKTVVTGHGIDTEFFSHASKTPNDRMLSTISRITPIKHIDVLLGAFMKLPPEYRFTIAGGPVTSEDAKEVERLRTIIDVADLRERVVMTGSISQKDARYIYQDSALFLHACGGGLDKVVLEAMSCGCLVLSSSEAAASVLPAECRTTNEKMAENARVLLELSDKDRAELSKKLRRIVLEHHSLPRLIQRLKAEMRG